MTHMTAPRGEGTGRDAGPRKRVAVFFGTRPEAIKMAPVVLALRRSTAFEPVVVSTGQHREMLDPILDLFGIPVDADLRVMTANQTLAALTARLLAAADPLLAELAPDMALVQGDTTTVLATALACAYRRIPVGHVEAGLRTGDRWSPFPEEINRRMAAPLMTLHFAPTENARHNLLIEGTEEDSVEVTGNTVIDALLLEVERQKQPPVGGAIARDLAGLLGDDWQARPFILVTAHRRESFGQGFAQICEALAVLADRFPAHRIVYPVHLNPNVRGPVYERLAGRDNIALVPPVDYSRFVALMRACRLILTDSGGIQEEAPALGKPVLVMRDKTERPEGVAAGAVLLVGTEPERIVAQAGRLLTNELAYRQMARTASPYGDGRAADRVVDRLTRHFGLAERPVVPPFVGDLLPAAIGAAE